MDNRFSTTAFSRNWASDASTEDPATDKIAGRVFGYTAVFFNPADPGTEYNLSGNVWERIGRNAFDRAIREKHNARCQMNHDSNYLLGTVADGSVTLRVDRRGLFFECFVADTQPGRDGVELINRRSMTGCSFAFRILDEVWKKEGNKIIVEITDLELFDIGPVVFPAYTSTPIAARDESRRYVYGSCTWESYQPKEMLLLRDRLPPTWRAENDRIKQRDKDLLQIEN